MVMNRNIRLSHLTLNFLLFKQTTQTLIRCLIDTASDLGMHFLPMFIQVFQITLFFLHVNLASPRQKRAAINNRYLDSYKRAV